ncbi:hypothetical protein Tco_1303282 [Tanacetum coccineum]
MQTQEDHSNPIPALNVDSLKVDLVVIQNTCSEKEDSNSENASNKLVKECSLNSETKDVHAIKYKMSKAKERCMTYFRSLHSHLQVLSKDHLKGTRIEHGYKRAFIQMTEHTLCFNTLESSSSLLSYTYSNTRMQTLESEIDMGKALDADLVDTESIRTDSTDSQHTEQPEIINEGRVDQYPEQCHVKSLMLDSSLDNQTTEYSKQSLESKNILLKKTVAQFQKDFSRMEAHCIALELNIISIFKSGPTWSNLKQTSNKAKIEKEFDANLKQ